VYCLSLAACSTGANACAARNLDAKGITGALQRRKRSAAVRELLDRFERLRRNRV
jgi:hypothetical protein